MEKMTMKLTKKSALTFLALAATSFAFAKPIVEKPSAPYSWNRVLPPLMKRDPDIVSMGPDSLCRAVRPPSQRTTDSEVRTSEQVLAWRRTVVTLSSIHQECWKRVAAPQWFAVERKEKITTTEGYDETKRSLVQQTLSAELNLGSQAAEISAKVKAELLQTTETIKSWKIQQQKEVDITYPKDQWLTVWALVETVSVTRTTTETNSMGDRRQVSNTVGPTPVTTSIEQVKAIYQDKATSDQMRTVNPKEYRK